MRSSHATRDPATWSSTRSPVAATPLQACAEGRIGVGNDLLRCPSADGFEVDPASPAEARTRLAALGLAWNADSAGWLSWRSACSCARPIRRRGSRRPVPAAGRAITTRASPTKSRSRSPADAGPAAVRAQLAASRRTDRPVPGRGADRDPARQERELSVRADAEHLLDGTALCPRVRGAPPSSSRRPATCSIASRSSSTACIASPCPPTRGIALLGDARDVAERARAALREAGRPDRARLAGHFAALPAGRQVRLLQLAADVVPRVRRPKHRRHLDDAHHREPYLAFLQDVLGTSARC